MKANELRIGNHIYEGTDKLTIVTPKVIQDVIDNAWLYTGIPLTDELLLKCGFNFVFGVWRNDKLWHTIIDLWKDDLGIKFVFDIDDNDGEIMGYTKLQYLHEIQNLYFSLTDEELTIK